MGIRVEYGPSAVAVGELAFRTGQNEYRKERRSLAFQTGRGVTNVGSAEESTGIRGAIWASEVPSSMGQALGQNSTIWLRGRKYAIWRREGGWVLVPEEYDEREDR